VLECLPTKFKPQTARERETGRQMGVGVGGVGGDRDTEEERQTERDGEGQERNSRRTQKLLQMVQP
jgi:hypothetical protein